VHLDELKRLYNACDPGEPLAPEDARYVDIDKGADGASPRRYDWIDHIASGFELAKHPRLLLLTGLPGSGKSTELLRVLDKLAAPEGPHLLPVRIDANDVINLRAPLELHELVFAVLAETERQIAERLEGATRARVASETVLARMWAWLTRTDVGLSNFDLGAGAHNLVLELRNNPTFKQRMRQSIGQRQTEFESEVRSYMDELKQRARAVTSHADILVVFDSLEQLRGISVDEAEVLRSAERVFGELRAETLGVHAIFTVPAALATRRFLEVQFMPLVKICEKDGSMYPPGHLAMRNIVTQRISEHELEQLLGVEWSQRIDRLVTQSGGYARELVTMLQEVISVRKYPVSEHRFEILLGDRADRYRRLVPTDAMDLIEDIAANHPPLRVPAKDSTSAHLVDLLITNNLLMVYQNREEWTDLNPAIRSLLPSRAGADA
jgi:hypothetical protein